MVRTPACALVLLAQAARAQQPAPPPARTHTLSGTVTDARTGEALIGATVAAPALRRGTTTNAYGFFSLALPAGRVRLVVSYVGYAVCVDTLALDGDRPLAVALEPTDAALGEVVVEADEAGRRPEAATVMSVDVVTGRDVRRVPALLGEADVLKALQLLPGVRGGSPDQNLVLLDGTPVYNASHLFGFLSVFNPDAVNRVELTKGGFPARYGGRLSSVVDLRLREGDLQRRAVSGAVGSRRSSSSRGRSCASARRSSSRRVGRTSTASSARSSPTTRAGPSRTSTTLTRRRTGARPLATASS